MNCKKIWVLLLICGSIVSVQAQTSVKLDGTPIGTQGFDYTDRQPSDDVNTIYNVFDGDLSTYFASAIDESNANGGTKGSRGSKGGWVGLDLGSKHIITSVKYAPRPDDVGPARVECGIIQGANRPDFMDAVAIGIISERGVANQLSTLPINSARSTRRL